MRSALLQARQCRNQKILDQNKFPRHNIGNSEQAFNMGTIEGARALQMESSVGSIAVGKLADIVVFDATSPSMICAAQHDPVTAIVRHATIRDVDTVIINGVIRKRNGFGVSSILPSKSSRFCGFNPDRLYSPWIPDSNPSQAPFRNSSGSIWFPNLSMNVAAGSRCSLIHSFQRFLTSPSSMFLPTLFLK